MPFFVESRSTLNNKVLKNTTCALISLIVINLIVPQASFFQSHADNTTDCRCVVFRLDDLQDFYLNKSQIAVMDLFLQKNQSLSIALILNALGNDTTVMNKIRDGYEKGKFELASHGWNHENFSKLNEREQVDLLRKSSDRMQNLFGIRPTVFIPPFYEFNNLTLDAAHQAGIKIISSLDKVYEVKNQTLLISDGNNSNKKANDQILHFPTTLQYSYTDGMLWDTYPVNQSLQLIRDSISSHGYAVVTLHPQGFANVVRGNLTDTVNATQINYLAQMMDSIIADNIDTTSFSKLGKILHTGEIPSGH